MEARACRAQTLLRMNLVRKLQILGKALHCPAAELRPAGDNRAPAGVGAGLLVTEHTQQLASPVRQVEVLGGTLVDEDFVANPPYVRAFGG